MCADRQRGELFIQMRERTGRPYKKVRTRTQSLGDEKTRSPDDMKPGIHEAKNMKNKNHSGAREKGRYPEMQRKDMDERQVFRAFFAGSVVAREGDRLQT